MESRVITTYNENTHQKKVFMSTAETVEQLKADFDANGVDYNGMTLYEGNLEATIDGRDETALPRNITRRSNHAVTNDLMIFLVNDRKKIKSGADRKELYKKIVEYGLKEKCYTKFDKSYTNCSSQALETLINEFEASKETNVDSLKEAFKHLLLILWDNSVISTGEKNAVTNTLNGCTVVESPYSDSEIEEMLSRI